MTITDRWAEADRRAMLTTTRDTRAVRNRRRHTERDARAHTNGR